MKFRLGINCENSAFKPCNQQGLEVFDGETCGNEVYEVLARVAKRIRDDGGLDVDEEFQLRDSNGNVCGSAVLTEEDEPIPARVWFCLQDSDIQDMAERCMGRKLTDDELSDAIKYAERGVSENQFDHIKLGIEEATGLNCIEPDEEEELPY